MKNNVGEYCVIENNVQFGENIIIGHHVVIHEDTVIYGDVRIDDFASIGKTAMQAVTSVTTNLDKKDPAIIGEGSIIGTGAIIYRGATIGKNCLVADLAVVREDVIIGDNTIIGKGATIENHTTIGSHVKIQTNAYITAYSVVGDNCFIAPCVVTSNDNFVGRSKQRLDKFKGVTLKKGGRISAGAIILPGKIIGDDALIAAGSIVTKDVPSMKVAMGIPAKIIRDVPEEQLLDKQ